MKPPAKGGGTMTDARFGGLTGAWELAWQTRFCPPEAMLRGDSLSPEVSAHLRACPCCAELASLTRESGAAPRTYPRSAVDMEHAAQPSLAPGQLWRLSPDLDGWGPKARYYNSPVVLVLKVGLKFKDEVLVAQTYHDFLLSGPGDTPLGPRRFAQPWNVYTLRSRDLAYCCGQVDSTRASEVLAASHSAFSQIETTSALYFFRQMEIELGCYFSSAAVFALLEERQTESGAAIHPGQFAAAALGGKRAERGLAESLAAHPNLLVDLLELGLELPENAGEIKAADLYFQAAPPAAELPLAASGADAAQVVPVVAYSHQAGRPLAWNLLEAQVTDFVGSPQLMVGGKLTGPLPGGGPWAAEFRWLDREGRMLRAQASLFTPSSDVSARFWASFPAEETSAPRLGSRLRIRLFREADDKS